MTQQIGQPADQIELHLNRTLHRFKAITEITERILHGDDLSQMLPNLLTMIQIATASNGIRLSLVAKDEWETWGAGEDASGMVKFDELIRQLVHEHGAFQIRNGQDADHQLIPSSSLEQLTQLGEVIAAYPVPSHDQTQGVLWALFANEEDFSNGTGLFLQTVAFLIASAVQQARTEARLASIRDNQMMFVSTVSHDLRSPLTVIKGYATMIQEAGPINANQEKFIQKIVTGVGDMTLLVDKILDAGRLDPEGNFELKRSPCDVVELIGEVISAQLLNAETNQISLDFAANVLPILNLDEVMLKRAIGNLVDNAIKYTPAGGKVRINPVIVGDDLQINIIDSGLGISEENQKLLFERFKRIPRREHARVKGSGLGLYIVRGVAQRHGGDAFVKSVEGQGSTFTISIPLKGANLIGAQTAETT